MSGMSVLGGIAGARGCPANASREANAACVGGLAALGPALLSARSVAYQCS
jgi:hypothetical protein